MDFNNVQMRWGITPSVANNAGATGLFSPPFPNGCSSVQLTPATANSAIGTVSSLSKTGFVVSNDPSGWANTISGNAATQNANQAVVVSDFAYLSQTYSPVSEAAATANATTFYYFAIGY
jgi:hypothetical protein